MVLKGLPPATPATYSFFSRGKLLGGTVMRPEVAPRLLARFFVRADGICIPRAKGKVRTEVRELVWRRDGRRCVYCLRWVSRRTRYIDHKLPVARGGQHELDNLSVCCRGCNSEKGVQTPVEWQAQVGEVNHPSLNPP